MTKTRQKNNVTDLTSAIYVEKEIELSRPIRPIVVYDENQIGQQHDQSYRCGLCQKRN